MHDFVKYLHPGKDDILMGIYVNAAGKITIPQGGVHPTKDHPKSYSFSWDKGRILNEYQICYIIDGQGIYEDNDGKHDIQKGSIMIIRSGNWHRYRPLKTTGWKSNYVGFSGPIPSEMFKKPVLYNMKPVINIGNNEAFIEVFYRIFENVIEEKPGFQLISAGYVMSLIGLIISSNKQKEFAGTYIEKVIQNARFLMRESIESHIDFKHFAESNQVGYSYFSKMFKKYTGLPPTHYHLSLKIMQAREMLLNTKKSIKEISFILGFDSPYYFSRLFTKKLGIPPTQIRKKNQKKT